MAYTEFHIDGRYKFFTDYYNNSLEAHNANPFWANHRTFMQTDDIQYSRYRLRKWEEVRDLGIFAQDAQGNYYVPLIGNLVVPATEQERPFPLVMMLHGQSKRYYQYRGRTREVRSYNGYRYLQHYLADQNIASISVNLNVPGTVMVPGDDFNNRLSLTFLFMNLLRQLSGTPFTTDQQICFVTQSGALTPLHTGLEMQPPYAANSPEQLVHELRDAIRGKLDFENLGFMGHSRGATSVGVLQPFFSTRRETAISFADLRTPGTSSVFIDQPPTGIYNSNTRITRSVYDYRIHRHLYHYMHNVVGQMGLDMSHVKCIVALQPNKVYNMIDHPGTFYFNLASSHDNDVQEDAFNAYDNGNCPKAMVFSHGATHLRFNAIWRRLRDSRRKINRLIRCQSPIRVLSNQGHEDIAKATLGNAFLATLNSEPHRLAFYTGELRANLRQDIERAWKFPGDFVANPALVLLDGTNIRATNMRTNAAVTPTDLVELEDHQVNGHDNFANRVAVKAFTRPAADSLVIRIPIVANDRLATRTHFSFRYTKEYDGQSARARRNVNFRNYTLRLKRGATTIGNPIVGQDVPSSHHRAYPTKDINGSNCVEDTVVILQTAEVPFSQFLSPNSTPVTDLQQVDTIEVQLEGRKGASGDEIFFFVDFLLTTRSLPAPPPSFEIP
ncbi:MAG: hypothetical protein AAF570_07335 [Bacteroidota bacterium]